MSTDRIQPTDVHPDFEPQFDLGFGLRLDGQIEGRLAELTDQTTLFERKILDQIARRRSRVTTHATRLRNKLTHRIADGITRIRDGVERLRDPLERELVNRLASLAERASVLLGDGEEFVSVPVEEVAVADGPKPDFDDQTCWHSGFFQFGPARAPQGCCNKQRRPIPSGWVRVSGFRDAPGRRPDGSLDFDFVRSGEYACWLAEQEADGFWSIGGVDFTVTELNVLLGGRVGRFASLSVTDDVVDDLPDRIDDGIEPPDEEPPEDCIRICPPDEEPVECPEPEPVECTIWLSCGGPRTQPGLYSLPVGDSPRNDGDVQVGTSTSLESLTSLVAENCRVTPPGPDRIIPPPVGRSQLCIGLPPSIQIGGIGTVEDWCGAIDKFVQDFKNDISSGIGGFGALPAQIIGVAVGSILSVLCRLLAPIVAGGAVTAGCDVPATLGATLTRMLTGIGNVIFGGGLSGEVLLADQVKRFLCPTQVPTEGEAAAAFLSNTIDRETLRCWVRSNNRIDEFYDRVIEAGRTKLTPFEILQLWRRQFISDGEYSTRLREIGFLRDQEKKDLQDLSIAIPPISDLIRMMVRDAADDQLAAKFGMDDLFEQKWAGQVRDWGEKQGIEPDFARFVWRSHWQIPAPGQLAEMFFRSKRFAGRTVPEQWNMLGIDQASLPPEIAEIAPGASFDDVVTALIQQDILPFWVPKFLAIQFRPLSRRDIRRAASVGAIDEQGMRDAFGDLGYSPRSTDVLVEFENRNRMQRLFRHTAVGKAANGDVNFEEFTELLSAEGFASREILEAWERASLLRKGKLRKECVRAIRKRFQTGELEQAESVKELIELGVAIPVANDLLETWQCELAAMGKQAQAAQLCRWLQDGLVAPDEVFDRLIRLRWSHDDAVRLLRECEIRLQVKVTREQRRRLREVEAEQRRAEAERRRSDREFQRQSDRLARAREKARKSRERRQKMLTEAAERMAKKLGTELPETVVLVNRVFLDFKAMGGFTLDEIAESILILSQQDNVVDIATLERETLEYLRQIPFGDGATATASVERRDRSNGRSL